MENASKALIIAGSLLLTLMIVSVLVLTFNSIRDLKETEASSEDVKVLTEYNRKVEVFITNATNKGLYGTELISLANLIQDYNERQADLKGYQAISLTVTFDSTKDINGIDKSYTDYNKLLENFSALENKVNESKNTVKYGITVEKYYGMRETARENYIKEYKETHPTVNVDKDEADNLANDYDNLASDLKQFKRKRLTLYESGVTYDENTGRVTSITLKEE